MRASSFSDDRVIRLVSTYFVPVHVSRDNYLMPTADAATNRELQRIDTERRSKHFEGGVVAVYILDPDGTVRATMPVQQAYYPDRFVTFLDKVIADSHAAPRRPEDVRRSKAELAPTPAGKEQDLALTVWTRTDGKIKGDTTVDYLDLKPEEWSKLTPPAGADPGTTWEIADATADRLYRLCYPPGPHWKSADNKIAERTLHAEVVKVDDKDCVIRLNGRLKMYFPFKGKPDDPYLLVTVVGYVHQDRGSKVIKAFNLVSVEAASYRTWQGSKLPREPFQIGVAMRTK